MNPLPNEETTTRKILFKTPVTEDKICSRTANIGTIGMRAPIPRCYMPYTENGIIPDLIIMPNFGLFQKSPLSP